MDEYAHKHNEGERREDDIRTRIRVYVKSRISDQIILSGVKLRKTAEALKKTGNCFDEEDQRIVGEYVNKVAGRVDRFSEYLQDTPLNRIEQDTRELSLRRPWLFMGACFTTGVVLARLLKVSQGRD